MIKKQQSVYIHLSTFEIIIHKIMSTLFVNRAQSANARLARRSPTNNRASQITQRPTTTAGIRRSPTNNRASQIQQRPTTTAGIRRSHIDVYDEPTSLPFELSIPSETPINRRRSRSIRTSSQSPAKELQLDDIKDLLQYLGHDDSFIVKVDCLAHFDKLAESINLRKTPINCKILYELQKLENRIIQQNACHDTRFLSLLNALGRQYVIGGEKNDPKNNNPKNLSVYQSADNHIEF